MRSETAAISELPALTKNCVEAACRINLRIHATKARIVKLKPMFTYTWRKPQYRSHDLENVTEVISSLQSDASIRLVNCDYQNL